MQKMNETMDVSKKLRWIASGTLFGLGLAVIGVLAIPAVIIIGVIVMIWNVIDKIMNALE